MLVKLRTKELIRRFLLGMGLFLVSLPLRGFSEATIWNQWRGPHRNGIIQGLKLLDPDIHSPEILWNSKVGDGLSSFVLTSTLAITLGSNKTTETVYALSLKDGQVDWEYSYACEGEQFYTGSTPALDSGFLYVVGKKGKVFCFQADTGQLIWTRDLVVEESCLIPDWGFTGSPWVNKGRVFLNAGSSGYCLDAKTGVTVWGNQSSAEIKAGYASPVHWEYKKQDWILLFSSNCLQAVDMETGAVQFNFPWTTTFDVNAADPIPFGSDVFISSGHGAGAVALQIQPSESSDGHPYSVDVKWKSQVMRNFFSASILKDETIYGIDGNNDAALKCVDFQTGDTLWSWDGKRIGGVGLGTFFFAGERIVLVTEKGKLVIGKANRGGFELESALQVLGGKCWTAPALSGDILVTRNSRGETIAIRLAVEAH